MDKNKVKYGLRNCYYAPATEGDNGVLTYSTPKRLPGAISISMTPRNYSKNLAADDVEYWRGTGTTGYDGDLTLALIPDDFRKECLGELLDATDKVAYENSEMVSSVFALLFEFQGDKHGVRHVLYNCTATRPNVAGPADGPDPSQGTEAVTIAAAARASDGLVKARTTADTTASVYNNWFTSVWEPN